MIRIAILDDYQRVALKLADWSVLPKDARITMFDDNLAEAEAVIARLRDFEVICAMRERTPLTRAVIERLPNLKLIVTTGMRNASIDVKAAAERGVVVCGTRGIGHPTPELSWGLILALMRHIPFEHQAMRQGRWQTTLGVGLKGRVLGLLGLGNIGAQMARVGAAFGMDVVAWSQNLTAARAAECSARLVAKDELLAQADVVSIHLVLSERTRGLVGKRELALMKPTAYLVNTSRGPIVEEAALIEALANRRIAGAGLDVYDIEPLPAQSKLRSLDNVVLTPHLGYVTEETYRIFYPETVEAITAWLAGAPVRIIQP